MLKGISAADFGHPQGVYALSFKSIVQQLLLQNNLLHTTVSILLSGTTNQLALTPIPIL